jgi:hypothetical protein
MRLLTPGFLLLAASCGSAENEILVTLSNLPARTDKVSVNATLDGKPAMSALDVTSPRDSFGVRLPAEQAGHLVLNIGALDSEGCTQGSATSEHDLPLKYTSTALSLLTQSPRKCGSLPACAENAACAINKLPAVTAHLESMWAFSSTDIWAVGDAGTIVHWDGAAWSPYDFGLFGKPTGNFYGVWGNAPDDIWAVGSFGLIHHYDGTRWTSVSSSTPLDLYGVWGISRSEVYAVGLSPTPGTAQGTFLRYNGSGWSSITTAGVDTFNAVWADNSSDSTLVYACGDNGLLVRYDPSKSPAWAAIISNTGVNLNGIWGTRSTVKGSFNNTVFAVGGSGTILRFRFGVDSGWLPITPTGTTMNLFGIRGSDAQGVIFAYGQSGTVVRAAPPYDSFTAQTGSVSGSIYAGAFARPDLQGGLFWLGGAAGTLGFIDLNP